MSKQNTQVLVRGAGFAGMMAALRLAGLRKAFQHPAHVEMMRYTFKHPDDLVLGNETLGSPLSTRYLNEPGGFALAEAPSAKNLEEFAQAHGIHEDALS